MFEHIFFYLILLIFNLSFLFNFKKISQKIKILDIPNTSRKIHRRPTPLLGGLLIYSNIVIYLVYFFIFDQSVIFNNLYFTEIKPLIYFIFVVSLIFLIGIYDDKHNLSAILRLILISILIIFYLFVDNTAQLKNLTFSKVGFEITFGMGSILFSYLCLIIFLISCNMLDGINLQSFIFYIANFVFLFFIQENLLILLIIFSLIIFAILNYNGKIFLGDSGVYLISILLGVFYIKYYNLNIGSLNADVILSILLFPVLDATRCISIRIFKGKNPFEGDRKHFHHLLLKKHSVVKSLFILTGLILIPFVIFVSNLSVYYSLLISTFYYFFFVLRLS